MQWNSSIIEESFPWTLYTMLSKSQMCQNEPMTDNDLLHPPIYLYLRRSFSFFFINCQSGSCTWLFLSPIIKSEVKPNGKEALSILKAVGAGHSLEAFFVKDLCRRTEEKSWYESTHQHEESPFHEHFIYAILGTSLSEASAKKR